MYLYFDHESLGTKITCAKKLEIKKKVHRDALCNVGCKPCVVFVCKTYKNIVM